MRHSREYPGPFAGPTNPPPTRMDLALLDAVLEGRPYSRVGAYLFHLRRNQRHEQT